MEKRNSIRMERGRGRSDRKPREKTISSMEMASEVDVWSSSDAEVWMIGVYCGVFLSDKEILIQRRVKMRKRKKKAAALRIVDSSAIETSNSTGSSEDYLPSR